MIIYNVTIKVAHQIAAPWLEWMKTEHMPQLMTTGCFSGYKLFYLMEQDESDGVTYCAQYACASLKIINAIWRNMQMACEYKPRNYGVMAILPFGR